MTPFRSRGDDPGAPLPASDVVRDAVAQMVRQFADPLALYRELVQNSLDAGSSAIDVRLTLDPDDGRGPLLRVSVSDDGAGMDRDAIERYLLVLFRSSKTEPHQIGRFGVGFFSVLAVEPERVVVDTGRDGGALRVTLLPDCSYTIEQTSSRQGTAVTLYLRQTPAASALFARASHAALARWCPHVAVPLRFATVGIAEHAVDTRIDTPFAVDSAASVVERDADGTRYALGTADTAASSFYKRGILLATSSEPLVPGVALKIDSDDFRLTLSRDDVRRDLFFEIRVGVARDLARGALRARVIAAFNQCAETCARARRDGHTDATAGTRLGQLASALLAGDFAVRADELAWPLMHAVANAPGLTAHLGAGLFARDDRLVAVEPSPLTAALAAHGIAVVDLGAAGTGTAGPPLRALFERLYGTAAASAERRYCAPRIVDHAALPPRAARVLAPLCTLLDAAGLPAAAFARPLGAGADRLFLALDPEHLHAPDATLVLDAADTAANPFALFANRGVALNLAHRRVRAALEAAETDPALAAFVLARFVLLAAGRLDAARDRALLAHVLPRGETP